MENDKFWKYTSAIVFGAVNFMCLSLVMHEVFWYDEAYTAGMIQREFSEIISITSKDVHTPFYYFVLKLFYMTFGMTMLESIKVFSWIWFAAYLILGEMICLKHFNAKIGTFWMLLSCFMPSMIIQATTARMYTFGMFWVTLAGYMAYSLYQEEKWRKWLLFTVASIVSVYIHTFSMIEMVVIYVVFLLAALLHKYYKLFGKIIISGLVVSICYLPWLFNLWHQFSRWAGWESGWSNTIGAVSISSFGYYFAEWFSSLERPRGSAVNFGIFLLLTSSVFAIKYVCRKKNFFAAAGMVVAVSVFGIAMVISVYIVPCFLGRYLFFVFGGVWLFFAIGLYEMKSKLIQLGFAFLVLFFGVSAYDEEIRLENESDLERYKQVIETEWKENDIIMADTYFALMMSIYYPEKDYMQYGGIPSCIPFDNCTAFTDWKQLEDVKNVWYLSFSDFRTGNLDEMYNVSEKWELSFSYYDLVLEKYVKKESR